MPSSEDYTVVWAGLCRELDGDEAEGAEAGVHPWITQARVAGMEHWFDTFDDTPEGEPIFSLLIGERVDVLGFKEGRTRVSLTAEAVQEKLQRIDGALAGMGLDGRAAIHILLRIEE